MTYRYAPLHADDKLSGAGDARPTAQQIIDDNNLVGKLDGKVALVTGCSSGLGIETARALLSTGMKVFVTARDEAKAHRVLADMLASDRCELLMLDLNSLESVETCAKEFLKRSDKLNILVNNAGIMALPTREFTKDGFEAQFGTNHLAHFLLFQRLKKLLLSSATPDFPSKVICVSSSAHKETGIHFDDPQLAQPGVYGPWIGYGQSKTANVYMANEIDRRYGSRGLRAFSLHPGGIWTGLQIYMDTTPYRGNPKVEKSMKSVEQGAATTVYAALDHELEGKGGLFLEDCQVAVKSSEAPQPQVGYAKWAYDEEAEKKLWKMSCEMVGIEDDD